MNEKVCWVVTKLDQRAEGISPELIGVRQTRKTAMQLAESNDNDDVVWFTQIGNFTYGAGQRFGYQIEKSVIQ